MALTNEFFLGQWLMNRVDQGKNIVASHEIQLEFPKYTKVVWGALLLPDTASRVWRKMRETSSFKNIGIEDIKEHKTDSKEKSWLLIRN